MEVRATRVRRRRIRRNVGRSITAALVLTVSMLMLDLRASSEAGTSVPAVVESSPADWASPLPVADGGGTATDDVSSDTPFDATGNEPADRKVRVVVLGKDHDVRTDADTVRQLLSAMGIEPDANDRVTPSLSTPLRRTDSVRFVDVTFESFTDTHKVDHETETRTSENLAPGESRIIQEGRPGIMEVTYKQVSRDGEHAGKPKAVEQEWRREPVTQIKAVGAEPTPSGGGEGGGGNSVLQTGTATWYKVPGSNYTAAHPTLPFGTRVTVTNTATGKSITVMINDRGPFSGAIIDLSDDAFEAIASLSTGVINVRVERAHGDSDINN